MEKKSEDQASIQSHLYSLFVPLEILNSFTIVSIEEKDEDLFIYLESKGGSSTRGSRKVTDGKRAEQGTPEYRDEIVKIMLNSGRPKVEATAIKIQNAIDGIDGATINYIQVTQKVNHSTGEIISKTGLILF